MLISYVFDLLLLYLGAYHDDYLFYFYSGVKDQILGVEEDFCSPF